VRVGSGQRGVVATDFRAGAIAVVEEEQVVNRDHLRRASGGNQQRMRRVGDVDVSGQPFDRRPSGAMPERVEDANGNPAIDDLDAEFGTQAGGRAVLPRTGEERDAIGAGGCVSARRFVHVFADAGTRAQGGPVVDEDAHLSASMHWKSTPYGYVPTVSDAGRK